MYIHNMWQYPTFSAWVPLNFTPTLLPACWSTRNSVHVLPIQVGCFRYPEQSLFKFLALLNKQPNQFWQGLNSSVIQSWDQASIGIPGHVIAVHSIHTSGCWQLYNSPLTSENMACLHFDPSTYNNMFLLSNYLNYSDIEESPLDLPVPMATSNLCV